MTTPLPRNPIQDREVAGVRRAITWLHRRAQKMVDPHARIVLDSAATNLGWDLRRWQNGERIPPDEAP